MNWGSMSSCQPRVRKYHASTDDLWGIVEKTKRRRGKAAQRKGTVQALWQKPVACCFCFMLSQDSTWTFWIMLISKGVKGSFFFPGPEIPKIVEVNFNSNPHLVTQKFQKNPLIPSHNFPGWVTLSKHLQQKHLGFMHRSKKRRKSVNKKCKWRKKNNAWSCRRRWGSLGWKFVMVCGHLEWVRWRMVYNYIDTTLEKFMFFFSSEFCLIKQTKHPCFIKSLGGLLGKTVFFGRFPNVYGFSNCLEDINMTWMDCFLPSKTLQVWPRSFYRKTPSTYSKCTPIHECPTSNYQRKIREKLEEQERKRREEEEQRKKKDGGLDRLLHSLSLDMTKGMLFATPREAVFVFSLGFTRNVIFHKYEHQGDKCMNMDDCGWFLVMMERAQVILTSTLLWQTRY